MDGTFDRRKYPRVRTDALLSIARVDEEEVKAHAIDLSLGGLRFQCIGIEVEVGELLRVSLRLGAEEISVVGRMVRVTDLDHLTQECALAFVEVEPRALEVLRRELIDAEGA